MKAHSDNKVKLSPEKCSVSLIPLTANIPSTPMKKGFDLPTKNIHIQINQQNVSTVRPFTLVFHRVFNTLILQ